MITPHPNAPEFLKVADFLENEVPDERFRMANYFSGSNGEPELDANTSQCTTTKITEVLGDCGTAACAAGWGAYVLGVSLSGFLDLLEWNEKGYVVCNEWPDDTKAAAERLRNVARGDDLGDWENRMEKGEST